MKPPKLVQKTMTQVKRTIGAIKHPFSALRRRYGLQHGAEPMSLAQARRALREMGLVIRRSEGGYRVSRKGDPSSASYESDDLHDLVASARRLVEAEPEEQLDDEEQLDEDDDQGGEPPRYVRAEGE
jgi:DNA-binding transcriptional ArsR family regulator